MKRKKQRLRVNTCYEPNRFAQDNLINAYETLCPDQKIPLSERVTSHSQSAPIPPTSKRTRR